MKNYKPYRNKADNKLTEWGQQYNLLDTDLTTVLDSQAYAIWSNPDADKLPDSLVDVVTGVLTSTVPAVNPTTNMYVEWNGTKYKIQLVKMTNLTNEQIIVQLFVGN